MSKKFFTTPKKFFTKMDKFIHQPNKTENNIPLIYDKDYNFKSTLCIIHEQIDQPKTYIDPIKEYDIPPTLRIIHGDDF